MPQASWIITVDELKTELSSPDVQPPRLLDVREVEEWEEARLEGCVLVPLSEFVSRAPALLTEKDANWVIYCAHGVRSMHALRWLEQQGYTRLRSLAGGICEWEEAGFPVVRGATPEAL
jgi:rhodanese-related sulfurtransferase